MNTRVSACENKTIEMVKGDNALVTVITMVKNCAGYIEQCIKSVLNQTYPFIEHIIVDGLSLDGTVDIIKKCADNHPARIRFISEPDRGTGEAWNRGIKMAKGAIFGWVGSDDLYAPTAVDSIVRFFKSNRDAYFVYGGVNYIDEKGDIIETRQAGSFDWKELLNEGCIIPTPSSFYRREVFETVGEFDVLGNDLDFFMRVAKVFKIYRIDEVLSNFRRHNASQTTGTNRKVRKMWLREDCLVSRRHGGKYFSRYCKRYYKYVLVEDLRPLLGFLYPYMSKLIKLIRRYIQRQKSFLV